MAKNYLKKEETLSEWTYNIHRDVRSVYETICKIRQTWVLLLKNGYGIMSFLTVSNYRGEILGHTSLELQLPVNAINDTLIKNCFLIALIPHEIKTILNADGSKMQKSLMLFDLVLLPEISHLLNLNYKKNLYQRPGHDT